MIEKDHLGDWSPEKNSLSQKKKRPYFGNSFQLYFKVSLCYEYQFSFISKVEVVTIKNIFAARLTLKLRLRGNQKWSIETVARLHESSLPLLPGYRVQY